MKGDYLVLSIAAAHAAQCFFFAKKRNSFKQRYYRSTIKIYESSRVAAALFFIPSLWSVYRTVSEIFSVKNGVTLKPGVGVVQYH